jgi:hypothetical protein
MTWDREILVDCRNREWPKSSVRAAHRTMQLHLECAVGECPAKSTAYTTLVEAGKVVPDSSPGRMR